jgi:molybdopterin molybdotransferase
MSAEPTKPKFDNPDSGLISVDEARARILSAISVVPAETVPITAAHGRVAAGELAARLNHPPGPVSAMDGYALRSADAKEGPLRLRRIGVSRAGARFQGTLGPGECIRIFTGAVVPEGADVIGLQEDAEDDGAEVVLREVGPPGRFIRKAGMDFSVGQVLVAAGRALSARDIGLLASSGHGEVAVRRRPRVAILSTGDELVAPGAVPGPDQIVGSNGIALAAAVQSWGGEAVEIGIASDETQAIARAADQARGADLLITSGGASVGDHDLVQAGFAERDFKTDFWRIAMRPGKPLMFGHIGELPVLGVPGNPVSALVCAMLFLRPALRTMLGMAEAAPAFERARLAVAMGRNDKREEYGRGRLGRAADGVLEVTPFSAQDSAMQALLAQADCLIRRAPHAPPAAAGEEIEVIRLDLAEGGF